MNNDDPRNQRIKHVLERLTPFQKIVLYYRLAGALSLYQIRHIIVSLFPSPRARIHWVGSSRRRRIDKWLLGALCVSVLGLWQRLDLFWSVVVGGGLSLFLLFYGIYLAFPRKRAHWGR